MRTVELNKALSSLWGEVSKIQAREEENPAEVIEDLKMCDGLEVEDSPHIEKAWKIGDGYLFLRRNGDSFYSYPSGFERFSLSIEFSSFEGALASMMKDILDRELEWALSRRTGLYEPLL